MLESTPVELEKSNFSSQINNLLIEYAKTRCPIDVSFRSLVPKLNTADRATHLIHAYPAKLLMHIPYFFLNNDIFSKPGDIVLDPFSGSGTVLLEAILAGRNSWGADANPLARLISRVKTTKYDIELLRIYSEVIFAAIPKSSTSLPPKVCNINYWFLPHIQKQLVNIIEGIKEIKDEKYQDFFWVCFSNCIKKVSFADPRVSVPVKLKATQYDKQHPLYKETLKKLESFENLNVISKFKDIVLSNTTRFNNFDTLYTNCSNAKVISNDARSLQYDNISNIKENSVALIISSPPYAGAQKYIRASSLNLGWLNLLDDNDTLKKLEDLNIGREHYKKEFYKNFNETGIEQADLLLKKIYEVNPLRAYIASNYLNEMRVAFKESVRFLKPGGYFVLVAANNQVCGMEFKTQEYLMNIVESLGLKVVLRLIDDIKSYGLMTKRNKTANIITREWVLVFQK